MKLLNLAETIGQFRILNYIEEHYDTETFKERKIQVKLVDDDCVELAEGEDVIIFRFNLEKNKVEWEARYGALT